MKLWLYFLLFTAIIFSVLWLLQTVFLQNFYNDMLISDTRAAAKRIAENCGSDSFFDAIDELAYDNTMLVFLTDTNGNVIYSADGFSLLHNRKRIENDFGKNGRRGIRGIYRNLPDGFDSFLEALAESENGTVEYSTDSLYIYGTYVNLSGERAALYVSTTLEAVGSAVNIIRRQLVLGTILSVLIASALSWIIAHGFSSKRLIFPWVALPGTI